MVTEHNVFLDDDDREQSPRLKGDEVQIRDLLILSIWNSGLFNNREIGGHLESPTQP